LAQINLMEARAAIHQFNDIRIEPPDQQLGREARLKQHPGDMITDVSRRAGYDNFLHG
jgi:hypothetical protein